MINMKKPDIKNVTIETLNNEGIIKYYEVDNYHDSDYFNQLHKDFLIDDVIGILQNINYKDKFIVIFYLRVLPENRQNGIGSELIDLVLERFPDKLVFIRSCLLKDEFPTEPTDEQYDSTLSKNDLWLTKRKFKNINDLCRFEFSIPYIYQNEISKIFIDEINKDSE